ncbi:MAG: DUF4168 domain-containing protein [Xanthomonadaceae bacterium]|nr:DUF4168 domain-containing protein [Xanthomonadaceae bacterium]
MKIFNLKLVHLTLASIFAASMALSGASVAQQAPEQPQAATHVSEADLERFAVARESIVSIQEDYSARLQGAGDPEEAGKLQQQANEEMIGAVDQAGLDVESFNAIAMALQGNPELQQKLEQVAP